MADRQDRPAIMAHADNGSEDRGADAALARDIAGSIVNLVATQGPVFSDRQLPDRQLETTEPPKAGLPSGIEPWTYFIYRVVKTQ